MQVILSCWYSFPSLYGSYALVPGNGDTVWINRLLRLLIQLVRYCSAGEWNGLETSAFELVSDLLMQFATMSVWVEVELWRRMSEKTSLEFG